MVWIFFLSLLPLVSHAQIWALTGSLTFTRSSHTATLLPNGNVLVAGGYSTTAILSSAEFYNTTTGVWTVTGNLTYARQQHTATLLPNGNVLAAGGDDDGGNTAELYNAATGVWTVTGNLNTGRYLHTATLLSNGNVLVADGTIGSTALNSAELYNATTGVWTVTGSLAYAREFQYTATLLPNGNVLVAGGGAGSGDTAELYNAINGLWTMTGFLTYARYSHTATLLPNENVLIAAGHYIGYVNSAELYNATTAVWTVTGFLTYSRYSHTATLLTNGNVLVAGGTGVGNVDLNIAEVYNVTTGLWTVTGNLTYARQLHTATLLPDGNVLVAGGNGNTGYLNSAELYIKTNPTTLPGSLSCCLVSQGFYSETAISSNLQVNCTNCDNTFTTLGNFSNVDLYNIGSISISLSCTNCPGLVDFGLFDPQVLLPSISLSCTNCPSLQSLGDFSLATSIASSLSLSCTNCPLLQALGEFASLNTSPQVILSCFNCSSLKSLGSFSSLISAAAQISLSCTDCSSLTLLGSFTLMTSSSSTYVTCSNCPSLLNLGDFYSLTTGASILSVSCMNCSSLTSLGTLPILTSAPYTLQISFSCINCFSLQSLGNFSMLSTAYSRMSASCSNCNSLLHLGVFPLLASINSPFSLSCVSCPLVSSLGNFPSLSTDSPISLSCTNCSSMTNTPFPLLPPNQLASSISFTCNSCPFSFALDAPIVYNFSNIVPTTFSAVASAASLSFSNAILPVSWTVVGLFRIHSLSFVNVVGGLNLDFVAGLDRIDGGITIQSTTFTNIDGITTNLALVESVTITDNPLLCNINTNTFQIASTSPPIISNNGFNTNCSILEPVTPFKPSLVSYSSSTVELTWTLPQQPSVSTTYTLTINGVAFLTFPSWNPVSVPYTVTSLSASSTYTFVLTAVLGAILVSSSSLTIITDSGTSSGCLSGYYKPNGTCTACGMAQFSSLDLFSCVSCPSGTYANSSALASSASCLLCPSGTYSSSSESTQCSSCPSSNYCPLGATAALSSTIPASSANETSVSSSTSNGLSLGYLYLVVFFALAFVTGLVVAVFPKRIRSVILKFTALIRTPRFLFRVNPENWTILELPSVIRGLIGFWVLLGLIVVTAYQINSFIVNQFGSSSTIQPGTKFSSGQPILSATTIMNVTVLLIASPITCDPSLFSTSSTLNGAISCTNNATTTTLTLTTPLSSLPSSATNLQLSITATNGNLAYSPALQYSFTSLRYNNLNYSVSETIVGGSNNVVTGTSTINIAAVATESLDVNGVTLNTGYDFSYISTSTSTSNSASSSLVLSFQLSVPQYFLQVRQVVAITPLVFLSGLLAIGGGVITIGTLIAFIISYVVHHWLRAGAGRDEGSAIELVKSSKEDPRWF